MFDLDKWQEILDTISKNKLRTFLTGFSVAWGIFMLIILLGSGQGLSNGVEYQFRDDAINSIWIRSGQTSLPHKGLKPGPRIRFTNEDFDEIRDTVDGVEHITSRFCLSGTTNVAFGKEHGSFDVRSVHPGHRYLENTIITRGRFLNAHDLDEFRKTAVIGEKVESALLKEQSSIGEYIKVNGSAFRVVGVFADQGPESETEKVYLPITTAQRAFSGANRVHQIMLTTGDADLETTEKMAAAINRKLAQRHSFSLEDRRAVFIDNLNESWARVMGLMNGIRLFVWVFGIGTILAGVVGVSNIMLVIVRERTPEIGIRRAIGASPASVMSQIILKAILLTSIAGYAGLIAGLGLVDLNASVVADGGGQMQIFCSPGIDPASAGTALLILVVSGTLAGIIPARRAVAVSPVAALRAD